MPQRVRGRYGQGLGLPIDVADADYAMPPTTAARSARPRAGLRSSAPSPPQRIRDGSSRLLPFGWSHTWFGLRRPRGISRVDRTPRAAPGIVGTADELVADWRAAVGSRTVTPVLEPTGYVLLAACRPHEDAYEFAFDGVDTRGALSYWLLRTLAARTDRLTYRMLYDSVLGQIHGHFPRQTPILLGEADRVVFTETSVDRQIGVVVLEATPSMVRLATGTAQSLEPPARFAIYPGGPMLDSDGDAGLAAATGGPAFVAEVEVIDVEAATGQRHSSSESTETSPLRLACARSCWIPELLAFGAR